jgi:D-alanyl-D-alanine carboxypeptidase
MKYIIIILFITSFSIVAKAQKEHKDKNISKLLKAYPDCIVDFKDNQLIFKDGSSLIYDDGIKHKSNADLLNTPDIEDQFYYSYQKGAISTPLPKGYDSGRIRNEAFFKNMYGKTEGEVEKNLVEITWCPKTIGQKIKVTKVNSVDKALICISEELDNLPVYKQYLLDIGGTFKWRKISGTNRLSMHSFGMTIDINVKHSHYWQWDCKCTQEDVSLGYNNNIPQKIVEIFEKHGFIWGGKWYHYDTMHFEYRPELLK